MTGHIVERRETELSPWVTLVEKDVQLPGTDGETPTFHSLLVKDYVSVLAILPNMSVVLVRQYRPAVEREVLEFPGGLVDAGESSLDAAKRELLEECGLTGGSWGSLGRLDPDVGRLENTLHAFVCLEAERVAEWFPEEGVSMIVWPVAKLMAATRAGDFSHSQHVAMIGLALAQGILRV